MAFSSPSFSKGSGKHCCVHGCSYNEKKLSEVCNRPCFDHFPLTRKECCCGPPYKFYTPAKDADQRREWLSTLQLKNPPKFLWVCSFHFVDKKPTERNPLPQLMLGYERAVRKPRRILVRSTEGEKVNRGKRKASSLPECETSEKHFRSEMPITTEVAVDTTQWQTDGDVADSLITSSQNGQVVPAQIHIADTGTQWTDPVQHQEHAYSKVKSLTNEVRTTTFLSNQNFGMQCTIAVDEGIAYYIIKSDTDSHLYTGIPEAKFHALVACMRPFAAASFQKMLVVDQILLTLMKLRLNLLLADLARRFSISEGTVSKIISYWIDTMAVHLTHLLGWLPRETIQATMPACFKAKYPKTTVIVDCAETIMQKANNLESRGESYSTYKSHNTVKYLVAIAPSGYIMFISNAYGGRASDKYIVQDSGFLQYLLPGDEVMADRGFTIEDLVFKKHAKLNIPAFTQGRQLSEENVTKTRRLARVRIHVERAIRRLKVFHILKETIPVAMASKIDCILRICAALVNLRGELIREKESSLDD